MLPIIVAAAGRSLGRFMPELIAGNSLAAVKPVAGFTTWSPWLELAIVALYPAALLLAADALPLLPPHPASKSAPAMAGNAARRMVRQTVNRRLLNPPSMMISSRCGG